MASPAHPKPPAHRTTLDHLCDTFEDVAFIVVLVCGVAAVASILVLLIAL